MSVMYLQPDTPLQNGRYRIVRYISSGGFGCTYEAVHVKLGKRVAIKEFFVKDFCNRDEDTANVSIGTVSKVSLVKRLAEKFCEEAQALSQLNHQGIVKVTDVFDENGTSYFVMDFIDGPSLSDIIKSQGPMPEHIALHYIQQVAMALRYVHRNNRLHLDVKPGNIMVDAHDNAILIDFGASKQYDEVGGENTSTLLGKTPGYAPIEQMGNDVVKFTPSTDVYALGATLYKLLTGITPKSATLRVSGEELDPLPDYISPATCGAVYASMELNKNNRPQSIDDFLMLLNGSIPITDPRQGTTGGDDITRINDTGVDSDPSSPSEPSSLPPDTTNPPVDDDDDAIARDNKRRNIIIGAVAAAAVVIIVVAVLLTRDNKPETVNPEPVITEQTDSIVTDREFKDKDGDTFKYTGPVNEQGQPHGMGKSVSEFDGFVATYEGEYENGYKQGKGTYVMKDSKGILINTFTGTFQNDQYQEGKLLDHASNTTYQGTFRDGVPYNGTWYLPSGRIQNRVVNGKG